MKKNFQSTFDFKLEVLPISLVCILLNLLPLYFRQENSNHTELLGRLFSSIYLDMSGTILASMLLGPWWAAIIGIIGSTLSGLLLNNYFPFIIVNISGGVTLGYFFLATNYLEVLKSGGIKDLKEFAKALFTSYLVIGLVCGFFSWVVKITIYPLMGINNFSHPISLYLHLSNLLSFNSFTSCYKITLLLGEFVRDLADKFFSIILSVIFLRLIGFLPLQHDYRKKISNVRKAKTLSKFRTDNSVIAFFILVYSCALITARIFKPEIKFDLPGAYSITWLKYNSVILLLYFPLIISIICLIFLSYQNDVDLSHTVQIFLNKRIYLYNRVRLKVGLTPDTIWNSEIIKVFRRDGIYGLLLSLILWPQKEHFTKTVVLLPIYFIATIGFVFFFFYAGRKRTEKLCFINENIKDLQTSLNVNTPDQGVFNMGKVIGDISRLYFNIEEGRLFSIAPFYLIPVISTSESILYKEGLKDEGLILLTDPLKGLSLAEIDQILVIFKNAKANWGIIVVRDIAVYDSELLSAIISSTDTPLLCIGWMEIENIVENCFSEKVDRFIVQRAKLRVKEYFLNESTTHLGWDYEHTTPWLLTDRALPSIKHILSRLPQRSYVLDLGAGRGRHSFLAADLGLNAIAVEKDDKSVAELKGLATKYGYGLNVNAICSEFHSYIPEPNINISIVIIAGVLHHASNYEELNNWLNHIKNIAENNCAVVFLEVLTDYRIESGYPANKIIINDTDFEKCLNNSFQSDKWNVMRILGPIERTQIFSKHGSFLRSYSRVDCTLCEYLIEPE